MPFRLLDALSVRRSPRPASPPARRRRLAAESLEGRELMAVDFTSALGVGSNSMSTAAVAVDSAGNTVVAGSFTGTVDFDPGAGVKNLTAAGAKDIYLAGYSQDGSLLWAKSLPSAAGSAAQANGVAIDAAGNISITGSLTGTADFNPGGGGGTLASAGGSDAFVAGFSPTGAFAWAGRYGGGGADQGGALAFDAAGNLLVTGTYTGATAFGSTTLTGTNASAFVTKLSPAGVVQWAQGFSGSSLDYGTRIAVDSAGNAYAGGIYQGNMTAGSTTLGVPSGVSSAYVAKLSPAGAVSWAVGFGGTANTTAGGLAVDGQGNILAAGSFKGTSNFGGVSLTSDGAYYNGYVTKLNAGGAAVWSKQVSGTNNVFIAGVGTDVEGAAYLGGHFLGTANLNPNAGTAASLVSAGGQDVFAGKLDAAGNLAWAIRAGGGGTDATGAIAMVGTDSLALVGNYAGPAVYGGSLLQSLGSTNMAVAKVSPPAAQAVAGPADFLTASSVGGNILDGRSVALDAAGNSYVTGTFNGTVDFDPGAGVSTFTAVGYKDIYVAAYAPSGALLWAKVLPGTGVNQSQGNAIAVDGAGNILVSGSFAGTVNFNPGGPGGSLTSAGGTDAFLVKLSPTGGFAWARRFGSTGTDQGLAVAVDGSGNAVVAGNYSGAVSFGGVILANLGSNDGFMTKVDASGNTLWATRFGGSGSDTVADLAADAAGNVYSTGTYTGASVAYSTAAGLSLSLLGNASQPSVFAMKLNADGGIAWVDGFTGAGNTSAGGVAVDGSGNVFVSGTVRKATNFGGISVSPFGAATSSAFLTKINPGGSVAWAQRVGGASPAMGVDVQTDSLGDVYFGGQFTGSTNFASGTGTGPTLGGYGGFDIFVAKYDTDGASIWARQAGGTGNDYVRSIAVKGPDDVTVVGMYTSTASFNTTLLSDKVNSSTMYVTRIARKS